MAHSLGKERVDEIKEHTGGGGYFPCHKTIGRRNDLEHEHDGWENAPMLDRIMAITKEQACVGARIWEREQRDLRDGD